METSLSSCSDFKSLFASLSFQSRLISGTEEIIENLIWFRGKNITVGTLSTECNMKNEMCIQLGEFDVTTILKKHLK